MKYVISGTNSKKVDKYTIENVGIPSLVLMERAALSVAEQVKQRADRNTDISIVCGIGNNGADGIALARILHTDGYCASVYIVGNIEKATEEFKQQLDIFWTIGGEIKNTNEAFDLNELIRSDIIVDALFGIGLSRDVTGKYLAMIEMINISEAFVISVDIPSGVNADNGKIMGLAIKADMTVTFGMNKIGMILYPGADYAGEIVIANIGIPNMSYDEVEYFGNTEIEDIRVIPDRINGSNKGTYGKIFIVAGSDTMTGAAYMCSLSALRMGAGMVRIATSSGCAQVLKLKLPEAIIDVYDDTNYLAVVDKGLAWCDLVIAGPGMGVSDIGKAMLKNILMAKVPCVLDADAINSLAKSELLKKLLHKLVCITPHVGEMSRLMEKSVADIKGNFIETAKQCAKKYGINVVLKDARTVVTDGTNTIINTSGNNGMSTAGSGDVLAGITGAVLARYFLQGNDSGTYLNSRVIYIAVAVFLHGYAGDRAVEKKSKTSLVATDMIDELIDITKLLERRN